MNLELVHYVYIAFVFVALITLILKKDIIIPCIIGILCIGFSLTNNIIETIQFLYNSLIYSTGEFLNIVIIISLAISMSAVLNKIHATDIMLLPLKKLFKSPILSFFILGISMMIISWFVWPSPAVVLIGAIMIPAVKKTGLPNVWIATSISLFGYAFALSSDFIIQGAPSITASATGILNTKDIIDATIPLWGAMCIGILITTFIMLLKDRKNFHSIDICYEQIDISNNKLGLFFAVLTPILFISDIIIMLHLNLIGNDATALIGGTSLIIVLMATILDCKSFDSFDKIGEYLKEGFIFGIKIFTPVIIISAFFFMGSSSFLSSLITIDVPSILNDIGLAIAEVGALSKSTVIILISSIGAITGLDGSGFSGLALVGSLSTTMGEISNIDIASLASLGQITAIVVGGGVIIPWAVVPVSAICGVKPTELVKKNLLPVIVGFLFMIITAIVIL